MKVFVSLCASIQHPGVCMARKLEHIRIYRDGLKNNMRKDYDVINVYRNGVNKCLAYKIERHMKEDLFATGMMTRLAWFLCQVHCIIFSVLLKF